MSIIRGLAKQTLGYRIQMVGIQVVFTPSLLFCDEVYVKITTLTSER